MANNRANINGRTYSWNDIEVNLLGRTVQGIDTIKYNDNQEKVENPGQGRYAVSRGYGPYTATASFSISRKEIEGVINALEPGKSLIDISPFEITITFRNDDNLLVTHILTNCEFLGDGVDTTQGDTVIKTEYELRISQVIWNP